MSLEYSDGIFDHGKTYYPVLDKSITPLRHYAIAAI